MQNKNTEDTINPNDVVFGKKYASIDRGHSILRDNAGNTKTLAALALISFSIIADTYAVNININITTLALTST